MKTYRYMLLLSLAALLVLPVVAALAQQTDQRISTDFRGTPLKDVIQVLKRAGNLGSVVLPEGAGDKLVTASIEGKTVPEALEIVVAAAGLTLTNDNGTYVIKDKPVTTRVRPTEPAPTSTAPGLLRTPPAATRPEPSTTEAGRGTAATTGVAQATPAKKDRIYRLIVPNYMNLMMLSDMFGGGYVSEDDYRNSISGGGGGYGTSGYGTSGSSGTGYGSRYGSSGSSRGGNRGSIGGTRTSRTGGYGY